MMPVAGAVEAFLTIYHALPFSVNAIIDVVLVFTMLTGVVDRILRL